MADNSEPANDNTFNRAWIEAQIHSYPAFTCGFFYKSRFFHIFFRVPYCLIPITPVCRSATGRLRRKQLSLDKDRDVVIRAGHQLAAY